MESTATLKTQTVSTTSIVEKKRTKPVLLTVADFEKWLSKKKTEYNYEFYHGEIIKKQPMKQIEFLIVKFLTRQFNKTIAYKNEAELLPEADSYIDDFRKRIPDLALFTLEQMKKAQTGQKSTTTFAIEILSDSESADHIETKIQDYFDAGVLTVWYIHPKTKKIYVYTSPNDVKIYHSEMLVNAQPALPDFEFPVNQLFETLN
jgi:Uma2 family endonuclease